STMGFWQVGFGLVFLLALGFSEALWRAKRTRSEFGKLSQDLLGVQSKELLLGPVQKLTWSFPSLPEEPQQPDVPFDLRYPVPANSVAARCAENSVYVEVMQDFFGNGKPLRSSAFTLGGCTAAGEDTSAQVLIFESELHGCGSTLKVTEDELVYMFKLVYAPQEVSYGVPIVRSSSAVVGIECHYSRSLFSPSGIFADDWRFERPSNQYFLGDIMNFEASVQSYSHVPIRVFVDSCVATTVPDVASVPRYSFIENNGPEQKACSNYCLFGRWVSADDSDQVCGCCDTTCSIRSGRDQLLTDLCWERASVGPISVTEYSYGHI
uniref:Zona pellucida sperm-binding protein 3 n=1 Tax=Sinocyclocheilus rhinocerous TaxID=307959 RepID=A0A673IAW7_9TELE